MSNVVDNYRLWVPGTHQHHQSGAGSEVPGLNPGLAVGATYRTLTASEQSGNDAFLFWSATGSTDAGVYITQPEAMVAFPHGGSPATMTAWYIGDSGIPGPGPTGISFDAFSLQSGEYLDWGDTFDPFTVVPAADRHDDLIDTRTAGGRVTATGIWPDADFGLVFDRWLTIGFASSLPSAGTDLEIAAHQTGIAFALYALPAGPPDTRPRRLPSIFDLEAVASAYARTTLQYTEIGVLAEGLHDHITAAAIRKAVLIAQVNAANEELKALA